MLVGSLAPARSLAAEHSLDQLSWLSGCWRTLDAEPGSGEIWTTPAGGSLLGLSRTVKGGQTTAFEFMRIGPLPDGRLAFFAQPSGRPPTTFAAVKISTVEAVFESAELEFPKQVIYRRDGEDRVNASIEGTRNGVFRSIAFPMERSAC